MVSAGEGAVGVGVGRLRNPNSGSGIFVGELVGP
jgi:hypothetical protein